MGTVNVVVNPLSRRMLLRGSAATLALPFLSSLLPNRALAATDADFRKAAFLVFGHGVYWDNWSPVGPVTLTQVAPGVRAAPLSNLTLGSYFGPDFAPLRSKVSLLEGLDLLAAVGHAHNTSLAGGGHTGGNDSFDARSANSIDTVLARSTKVYPTTANRIPVLRATPYGHTYSHCYEDGNPVILNESDSRAYFNKVVMRVASPGTPTPMPTPGLTDAERRAGRKKLMVDQALDAITALRSSGRLSMADRQVADAFFDFMRDVQTRVNAEAQARPPMMTMPVSSNATCPAPFTPDAAGALARARNMADITVMGLACGVSRLAYLKLLDEHDLVHTLDNANNRVAHATFLRTESLPVASHFMSRMESFIESNGKTLLDNSAVLLTSDLGASKYDNHCGLNVPVMVGGSLNGLLRTGQYVSFAHPTASVTPGGYPGRTLRPGRPYNDLLVSLLRAFGLTSAEYRGSSPGFGVYDCQNGACSGSSSTHSAMLAYYASTYFPANPGRDQALPWWFQG
ncbi:MAG: DUF1552 domain-containing protein [Myxococcaceae bacterium]|nr:DUF1552 domain-containing protein [Myxococcaceae bacterium]